jgi:hypothetical protein
VEVRREVPAQRVALVVDHDHALVGEERGTARDERVVEGLLHEAEPFSLGFAAQHSALVRNVRLERDATPWRRPERWRGRPVGDEEARPVDRAVGRPVLDHAADRVGLGMSGVGREDCGTPARRHVGMILGERDQLAARMRQREPAQREDRRARRLQPQHAGIASRRVLGARAPIAEPDDDLGADGPRVRSQAIEAGAPRRPRRAHRDQHRKRDGRVHRPEETISRARGPVCGERDRAASLSSFPDGTAA